MTYSTQPDRSETHPPSLALAGDVGYQVHGGRVVIHAAEIANNRADDDVSGTLAVELWALSQPYLGGDFDGIALAGTQIGELSGQRCLANCRYDLVFTEPGPGTWYLTLMLREWTAAGFVTRDHVNFALPYVVARKAAVVEDMTDNVISVNFPDKDRAPAPQRPAQESAALVETRPKGKPAPADPSVSLNHASPTDIAAIKGISMRLAERIVASRPFGSIEEMLNIKGVGPRLLDKLRRLARL